MIRLSSGTATLLGMHKSTVQELPTTAYLMSGQGCANNCTFCSQSRTSNGTGTLLSRVTWPEFSMTETVRNIGAAYDSGVLRRVCIQVVDCLQGMSSLHKALDMLKQVVPQIPVSVSAALADMEEIQSLFEKGADIINISLDGASPEVFESTKGKSWDHIWSVLGRAAETFPGRIRTHLICGLGETERDIADTIQKCVDLNIGVGLFAFTPVKGTPLEDRPQPPLNSYRRLQTANYLITAAFSRVEDFTYDSDGNICAFGIPEAAMENLLRDGRAFETSGCKDCNRPYYNESPRQIPYNYPRPLDPKEIREAIRLVLSDTKDIKATSIKATDKKNLAEANYI